MERSVTSGEEAGDGGWFGQDGALRGPTFEPAGADVLGRGQLLTEGRDGADLHRILLRKRGIDGLLR